MLRRPGDERLVAELGLRAVSFGDGRGDLLTQAISLGPDVDHPHQGQHGDDVARDRGQRPCPPLRRPLKEGELIVRDPRQRAQLAAGAFEGRNVWTRKDLRRDPAAGFDARLGSRVADGADDVDQRAEVRLGRFVSLSGFGPSRRS